MLTRRLGAALAAATLLLTATACGGDSVSISTPDGSVKVDSDGDGTVTIEGEDGSTVESGQELPDDFPSEVALLDGTIINALRVDTADGGGYSVTIERNESIETASDAARQLLLDAGFTEEGTQTVTGSLVTAVFRSATWQVLLGVTPSGDDDRVVVSYTVAPATS